MACVTVRCSRSDDLRKFSTQSYVLVFKIHIPVGLHLVVSSNSRHNGCTILLTSTRKPTTKASLLSLKQRNGIVLKFSRLWELVAIRDMQRGVRIVIPFVVTPLMKYPLVNSYCFIWERFNRPALAFTIGDFSLR